MARAIAGVIVCANARVLMRAHVGFHASPISFYRDCALFF